MNVLSSFNFGKVLKIALPGFVASVGAALAVDAGVALVSGARGVLFGWMNREPVLASFLAIPAAILAGLVINALLFTFLLERLVRRSFDAAHSDFLAVHREVFQALVKRSLGNATVLPEPMAARFAKHVDPGAFLLPTVDLQRFLYYQESYWSYLEFSVNMIVALTAAVGGGLLWAAANLHQWNVPVWRLVIAAAVVVCLAGAMAYLFLRTARMNYARHRAKFLSLFVGEAYAADDDVETSAGDNTSAGAVRTVLGGERTGSSSDPTAADITTLRVEKD